MKHQLCVVRQRAYCLSAIVFATLTGMTTVAQAHGGGGGPDVVLPPIVTSSLLGFVCYWLVILWPSAKKTGEGEAGSSTQAPLTQTHVSARVKRIPLLRTIKGGGLTEDVPTERKANDV